MVLATALTGNDYSRKLLLDPDTLGKVRGRFGSIEGWWKQQFGHGFEGLAESETRAIPTFDEGRLSAVGLRNRILAGKIPQVGSVGEEATGDRPDTEALGTGGRAIDTAAFREFFGNSQGGGCGGPPLPSYHSTAEEFDTFDPQPWVALRCASWPTEIPYLSRAKLGLDTQKGRYWRDDNCEHRLRSF